MATESGVTSKSDNSLTEGPSKGSQLQKPQVEIVTQYPQVRLGSLGPGRGSKEAEDGKSEKFSFQQNLAFEVLSSKFKISLLEFTFFFLILIIFLDLCHGLR